jgi:hypothetical protein
VTALLIGGLWLVSIGVIVYQAWALSPRREIEALERMWALDERAPR